MHQAGQGILPGRSRGGAGARQGHLSSFSQPITAGVCNAMSHVIAQDATHFRFVQSLATHYAPFFLKGVFFLKWGIGSPALPFCPCLTSPAQSSPAQPCPVLPCHPPYPHALPSVAGLPCPTRPGPACTTLAHAQASAQELGGDNTLAPCLMPGLIHSSAVKSPIPFPKWKLGDGGTSPYSPSSSKQIEANSVKQTCGTVRCRSVSGSEFRCGPWWGLSDSGQESRARTTLGPECLSISKYNSCNEHCGQAGVWQDNHRPLLKRQQKKAVGRNTAVVQCSTRVPKRLTHIPGPLSRHEEQGSHERPERRAR